MIPSVTGRGAWFAILAAVALAACSAAPESDDERFHSLISELRCLVCQNQSIAESNAPLAADLREQVRVQIAQGRSDQQIAAFLTDRYGDFVLYRPPFRLRTLVLWLGPFVALLLAALAAALYIRRIRSPGDPGTEPEESRPDPDLVPAAITLGAYGIATAALLIFAAIWYGLGGSWRTQALIGLAQVNPAAAEAAAVDAELLRVRARIAANPQDADAWAMAGQGEVRGGLYAAGAQSLAEANRLSGGQNPDWLVDEGEALAWVHEGQLTGAPMARFQAALALAPEHPRALWYGGLGALRAGDSDAAVRYWTRLLRQDLPEDMRAVLTQKIAEIQPGAAGVPKPVPAPVGLALLFDVSVAAGLAEQLAPGSTLMVYALEPGGPRMPLAVHRQVAGAGPWKITLDDSKSMLPGRKLSNFSSWKILARISASGDAQPQPGDLQGEIDLELGQAAGRHRLVIDRKL